MAVRHPLATLRRIGLVLMLLPFLALSLLAQGVMPDHGPGGLRLVLCTADGPVEMVVDLGQAPEGQKPLKCDWAAGHGTTDLPGLTRQPTPPASAGRSLEAPAPAHLRAAFDPRGLFARGPPATV